VVPKLGTSDPPPAAMFVRHSPAGGVPPPATPSVVNVQMNSYRMDLFWSEIEGEVRRRVLEDCGGRWLYGRITRRQLEDGIEVGVGDAWLHDARHAYKEDRRRKACRRGTDRAKDYLRHEVQRTKFERRAVEGALRLAGALLVQDAEGVDVAFPDTAADIPLLAKLELANIAALVEVLDAPQREVVRARYWDARPWEDVARSMHRRVAAVKALHNAGLTELRFWHQ
jgi:DNA-directed RNA polymerase specialized sigma24 family protein